MEAPAGRQAGGLSLAEGEGEGWMVEATAGRRDGGEGPAGRWGGAFWRLGREGEEDERGNEGRGERS